MRGPASRCRNMLQSAIIFCFFLPIVIIGGYSSAVMPIGQSWKLLVVWLLWGIIGSVVLMVAVKNWDIAVRSSVKALFEKNSLDNVVKSDENTEECSPATDTVVSQLTGEIEEKNKRIEELICERDKVVRRSEDAENEIVTVKTESEDQASKQASLLSEYQQTITEQREVIEKKHGHITILEAKVRDLNYEVRTLLQIGDAEDASCDGCHEVPHPVLDVFQPKDYNYNEVYNTLPISSDNEIHTPYDASVLLNKCITIAENLTGASHLAVNGVRSLDLSPESYAIDLRRLFDSFRNEHSSVVLVYSPDENRLLFVNNQVRGLLGWSPERFVKDVFHIVQKGGNEWGKAVVDLQKDDSHKSKKGRQVRMVMKTRVGEDVLIRCYLGRISKGILSGHIVGVLYPA